MKILITVVAVLGAIVAIIISHLCAKKRDKHFSGEQHNGYFLKKSSMAIADTFSGFIMALFISCLPSIFNFKGIIVYAYNIFFGGVAFCLLIYTIWLAMWKVVVETDKLIIHILFKTTQQIAFDDIYLIKEMTRSRITGATRYRAITRPYKAYDIFANHKRVVIIDEFVLNYNRLISRFDSSGIIEH